MNDADALNILPPPAVEGPGLDLVVVASESEQPIPRATLFVGPPGAQLNIRDDLETELREQGKAYRCDAQGKLRIPLAWLGRTVGARAGERWGSHRLQRPVVGETVLLRLAEDLAMEVMVVDGDGHGLANIPIGLFGSPYGNIVQLRQAVTDHRGHARLTHLRDPGLWDSHSSEFWVDTVAPKAGPPQRVFALQDLPQRTQLVLAHAASLTIQLRGLDGKPLQEARAVTLSRGNRQDDLSGASPLPSIQLVRVSDANGQATLGGLTPGIALQVDVAFVEDGPTETLAIAALQAGEHRRLEMRQQVDPTMLRLQVVDANRRPLSNQTVATSLLEIFPSTTAFPQERTLQSDATGKLHMLLQNSSLTQNGITMTSRALTVRIEDAEKSLFLEGEVDLSHDFSAGLNDLGEVMLSPAPLLAAGQVVDGSGNPLPHATVNLRFEQKISPSENFFASSSPQRLGSTNTDALGRFQFHVHPKAGRYTLQASVDRSFSAWDEVSIGKQDHRLMVDQGQRMELGSILAGRILLPPSLRERRAQIVFFQPTESDPDGSHWKIAGTDSDGNFMLSGLEGASGRAAVTLGAAYPAPHVLEFERVTPWRRGTNGDPRLAEIDLRELLHPFQVDAVDSEGQAVAATNFLIVRHTDSGTTTSGYRSLNGSYTFYAIEPGMHLTIQADGYLPAEVDLLQPETTVILERARRGSFQLDRMPPLQDNQAVALALEPIGFSIGHFKLEPAEFDANGLLETYLPPPGRYAVSLDLRQKVPYGWSASSETVFDATGAPLTLVIEADGPSSFHLSLPDVMLETPNDAYR